MRQSKRKTFILVAACTWLFGNTAHGMSQAQEIELGQKVERDVEKQYGSALPPENVDARRVARIGKRFAALSGRRGIPFHYRVLEDAKVENAFSAPGGPVFITRAMLERTHNDAELAVILGHETAHIEHRDIARRVEKQERVSQKAVALGEELLGVAQTRNNQKWIKGASKIAFAIWSLGYAREEENKADATSIRWMSELGYDPRAAVTLFRRMRGGKTSGNVERYLSTHPPTEEREANISRQIKDEALPGIAKANGGPRLWDKPRFAAGDELPPPAVSPENQPEASAPPSHATPGEHVNTPDHSGVPSPEHTGPPGDAPPPGLEGPPQRRDSGRSAVTPAPPLHRTSSPGGAPSASHHPSPAERVPSSTHRHLAHREPTPAPAPPASVNSSASPTPPGISNKPSTAATGTKPPASNPVEATANPAAPVAVQISSDDAQGAKEASPWLFRGFLVLCLVAFVAGLVRWLRPVAVPRDGLTPYTPPVQVTSLAPPLRLHALLPNGRDIQMTLPGESIVIGREADADFALADPQVSSHHALLRRSGDTLWIEDLSSTNGTWLDGQRIDRSLWKAGQILTIGGTRITWDRSGSHF